jgi:hypothetical protein
MSLRQRLGALRYDWPRFELAMRGVGPYRALEKPWIGMRNRNEKIVIDGRGVYCEWEDTSDLHIAKVFPSTGARLMKRAFQDWPIVMADAPQPTERPSVSFVIGHRGRERLPHLKATLRSIAGQRGIPIECVVVEQSVTREIEDVLPSWVRYVHTPVAEGYDYNRSWTLNAGVATSLGEVLVLHDNDMICPADYAFEAMSRAREGWDFWQPKRFTFYLGEEDSRDIFGTGRVRINGPSTIVQNALGASIAVTRKAFDEIGGFDESFVGWGGEDNEFWDRARSTKRAYEFGYLPFIHLWHPPQRGKLAGIDAPAVRRWLDVKTVSPEERIRSLVNTRMRRNESTR